MSLMAIFAHLKIEAENDWIIIKVHPNYVVSLMKNIITYT